MQYPSPGNPALAAEVSSLLSASHVELDHEWGLDHGTWTIIRHMYPKADIPVLQLSIDYNKGMQYHYDLARELYSLRKKGILIIGSGNMVHNLRMMAWDKMNLPEYGFDWALEANGKFKQAIIEGNYKALINYENMGRAGKLAVPTPDHFFQLIYTLGLRGNKDEVCFFNDNDVAGYITMRSLIIK